MFANRNITARTNRAILELFSHTGMILHGVPSEMIPSWRVSLPEFEVINLNLDWTLFSDIGTDILELILSCFMTIKIQADATGSSRGGVIIRFAPVCGCACMNITGVPKGITSNAIVTYTALMQLISWINFASITWSDIPSRDIDLPPKGTYNPRVHPYEVIFKNPLRLYFDKVLYDRKLISNPL